MGYLHQDFITMLDELTIPEAMGKIEKSKANKLREILKENQIHLFDVKRLWDEQQLNLMSLLGVLQQPAYWDKERWNKYK
jgi:hypothetical protein